MSWLLNALYMTLGLILSPWIVYRAVKTGRYRDGWSQKLFGRVPSTVTKKLRTRPVIWMHGVSVGEVQLLKPLVEQLASSNPEASFVISTTTSTGMELARKLFSNHPLIYFPFDFTWSVNRVLRSLKPSILVLGELELWPNLIAAAHRHDVPIAVVKRSVERAELQGLQQASLVNQRHV